MLLKRGPNYNKKIIFNHPIFSYIIYSMSNPEEWKTENEFLQKLFPNKIVTSIWFIGWSMIYKFIDMNTLQWFGKDFGIRGGMGWFDIIFFFMTSAFALSVVILFVSTIYSVITGKKMF